MKKIYKLLKKEIFKNKKLLIITITMLTLGFIFGTLFLTIIKNDDKKLVTDSIADFFIKVRNNKIDNLYLFKMSSISNVFYILLIFILGISIIGIPIILIVIFIKSFILGFSISSILLKYKFSGTILGFTYIFPHQIIYLFLLTLLSIYGMYTSISLYKIIFSKKDINFKLIIKRYTVICLICIIISILLSLFESFVTPMIINLFKFLIK